MHPRFIELILRILISSALLGGFVSFAGDRAASAGHVAAPMGDTVRRAAPSFDSANVPGTSAAVSAPSADYDTRNHTSISAVQRADSFVSHRDSVLQTVPTTLENGQHAKAETGARTKRGQRTTWRTPLHLVRQYWVTAVIAILACFCIAAIVMAVRTAGKKDEKRFMTTTRLSLMDGEMQRACLYIEKHFMDPTLSPATLCREIVTGEPFLQALFTRDIGMNIAAYINHVRIHRAKQVVAWNPGVDATYVAQQVGFSSVKLFEELFQELTGTDFGSYLKEKTSPAI